MTTTTLYNLKVWLTAVIFGASLIDFSLTTKGDSWESMIGIFVIAVILGCLLSLPCLLIQWAITEKMYYATSLTTHQIKAALTVSGVLLTALPFFIFGCIMDTRVMTFNKDFFIVVLIYALPVVAGVWGYKLPRDSQHKTNTASQATNCI